VKRTTVSERVLVLAPRGRDAGLAVSMLGETGIEAEVCASLRALLHELDRGAGAAVVTEEALQSADLALLAGWLAGQQEWSDFPFVLLTSHGGGLERNPGARRHLELLGNATFLERPFHPTTLISLVQAALRGRRRQYEARARLEALRESETRLHLATENAEVGFWDVDVVNDLLMWPARVKAMFGISPDLPVSMQDFYDGLHPEDRDRTAEAFALACDPEHRALYDVEYRTVGKEDGVVRWVAAKGRALFSEDGRCLRVVGTAIDITSRKLAEQQRRAEQQRLQFLGTLNDALRSSRDAPEAMAAAARLVAEFLGTTRCAYADVDTDADNDRFVIRSDWSAPGVPSSSGTYSLDLFGPRAAADMRQGRTLVVRNIGEELAPDEGREMFHAIGVDAIICCPLLKEGRLAAMMAVHQDRPRDWQPDEIALVETVVERCWAHVERVGAEARLRESETRYRTLFTSIEAGFCVVEVDFPGGDGRADYRVIEANPAFYRQTGFSEDILGRWLREAAPGLEEHWFQTYGAIARSGEPTRFELGSDMLGRWFDVYAFRIGRPEERRVAILFNDISARRNAEQQLRELNETLETRVSETLAERRLLADVIDGTDIFVQVADRDYNWLAINKAAADEFARIFGVERPKAGDNMLEALREQPEHQAAVRAVWSRALAGEEFIETDEFGDPSLDRRYYEMRFRTLRDANGTAVGAYQFVSDVTERLREQARLAEAEDALRQAQKMEAVGQLTGGVAHDFNNLLTIIKSSTELLRKPNIAEERRTMYVEAISDTVDRAAKLTGQLLAFARRQALKPEVFDVVNRLRSVAEMLKTIVGARIGIAVNVPDRPCYVKADISQFETALVNLAVNARDAMGEEGSLTIQVFFASQIPAMRNHQIRHGDYICIAVSDTGTGIPADRLTKIFEPFFTTKEVGKGTGLGLSQVYGFAQQSGGDIAVESTVGSGTRFTLYLPEVEGPADLNTAERRGQNRDVLPTAMKPKVLVVEDNVDVGTFSTQLLQDLGYETTWAPNADKALDLIDRGEAFDVVFSDVIMPGMSGIELGQELRRRYPGLPVVLTSGYSHVLAEEGRHGFELLHKPYSADELSRVVGRVAPVGAER
jgi:PAS domain S-box-containing protein